MKRNGAKVTDTVTELRAAFDPIEHDYRHAKKRLDEETKQAESIKEFLSAAEKSLSVLQSCAEQIQQTAHDELCGIVSRCLSAVFESPYEFKIEFTKKRSSTEANMMFCRNGETFDPLYTSGGGVIDVASFALRLSCLLLQPRLRRLLVLDEPFKMLSAAHLPNVKALIEELHSETGIQFLIITHHEQLKVGEIIDSRKF